MQAQSVKIGNRTIEVTEGHMYLDPGLPPMYDYVPWNLIDSVIVEKNIPNICLIDIGANVGDSLAQFRRFSRADVICVEPSDRFFSILERNSAQFDKVKLVNKIYAPSDLVNKLSFVSGNQTGVSSVNAEGDVPNLWRGGHVTCDDLMQKEDRNYVFKTDTDGFDCYILLDVLAYLRRVNRSVPIIFFEGPSAQQMQSGDFGLWLRAFAELQEQQYNLLFLTNRGEPYIYAGTSIEVAGSALTTLEIGYARNAALCHYYDVLAVHESVTNNIVNLSSRWGESIFRRS